MVDGGEGIIDVLMYVIGVIKYIVIVNDFLMWFIEVCYVCVDE